MMMNAKIRKYLSFGHAHTAHIITFHCQNVALKSDSTQLDTNLISLFSFRCGFEVSSAFDFFRFSFPLLFFLFVFWQHMQVIWLNYIITGQTTHSLLLPHMLTAADSDGTRIRKMPGMAGPGLTVPPPHATTFRQCIGWRKGVMGALFATLTAGRD